MKLKSVVFLILFCFSFLYALAATSAEFSRHLKNYSVEQGLSQSVVNKTVQDAQGFIWIGTNSGLNKFDGYNFEQISGPNNQFASDGIVTLARLNSNLLFVSTYYSGAYLLDTTTLQVTQVFDGKLKEVSEEVMSVDVVYEQGDILWMAIGQRLVSYHLGNKRLTIHHTLGHDEQAIRAITSRNNTLYLATTEGLKLYHIESGAIDTINHLPSNVLPTKDNHNVKSFLWHKKYGLLVGTVQGAYSFDAVARLPVTTIIPELNIWSMIQGHGEVFVGTQKGLFSLNEMTDDLGNLATYSDIKPLVTNNTITNIFRDSNGLLWLSSQVQGVFTFEPNVRQFKSYSRLSQLQLSHSSAHDFVEMPNGVYWVATNNGLDKLDSVNDLVQVFFDSTDDKSVFGSQTIYRIFVRDDGLFWLWHGDGLTLFDPRSGSVIPSSLSQEVNKAFIKSYPYGLEKVSDHLFFYITAKGHFALDTNNNSIRPLTLLNENFLPESSATFLQSFVNSEYIMLATTGGLVNYDYYRNTYTTIYEIKDFHIHDYKYVSDWQKDDRGNIWLVVNGLGVVKLDSKYRIITTFDKANGITDLRVYGIEQARDGSIWVSSQAGLYRIDKNNHVKNYTVHDGLVSNEVYEFGRQLHNGDIAFNSATGIVYFSPQMIANTKTDPPQTHIVSAKLASRELTLTGHQLHNQELVVSFDDFGLSFYFSSLNYAQQDKVFYSVELVGRDIVTFNDFKKNNIEFNKLEPGDYVFRVKAKIANDGVYGEAALIKFKVEYNPLASPLAYFIYFTFVGLLFAVFYIRRVRKQKVLQRAHDQLVNEQQKSQIALEASNSGIWYYDKQSGESVQTRLIELGHNVDESMPITAFFEYIHPEDSVGLIQLWKQFTSGELSHWDACFRVRSATGEWVWYRDLGRASVAKNYEQNRLFTGTYTNVNLSKESENQAQLYAQALRKMNEWLLILDTSLVPITSNPAFNKRFLADGESLNLHTLEQLFTQQQLKSYVKSIKKLGIDQKFIDEDIVSVPAGIDIPVLISISAIGDTTIENYVIVISDLSEQKKVENKLKYLANFDSLTHLANRTLIRDRIEQGILHCKENKLALFFVDLDRFKQVNDIHGHAAGDQLLVEVAYRMNAIVDEQHSVGRQSGDEFIILIEEASSVDEVSRYAERLTQSLAQPYIIENKVINISSSIGIAFYPDDANDCEELMQNADIAMLHAKQRGRNGYRFFTDEMNLQMTNRVLLENDFLKAVHDDELVNFYQPIIDIDRQEVVGCELLLRWLNDDNMVSPAVFIPMAESLGQIVKITEQALTRALTELKGWLSEERYLSVNLSAIHISNPFMVESLIGILNAQNVTPQFIRLEITEGMLIDDTVNAQRQLTKLREAGFQLFLDDFGTGYSSLTYINQFPIDVIKIDQCFVRQMIEDKTSRAIVQTIANLAHNIDSYCVVEGVEELEQVAILRQLGCSVMQGYFFARPMGFLDLMSDDIETSISAKIAEASLF